MQEQFCHLSGLVPKQIELFHILTLRSVPGNERNAMFLGNIPLQEFSRQLQKIIISIPAR